jgi:hypothetical protein
MATIVCKRIVNQFGGASPFGNATTLKFPLVTDYNGYITDSNTVATAVAIGDVIDLGQLPSGMRLDDAQIIVTTAQTALTTWTLGFKYEDGVDSIDVPQDASYFTASAAAVNTVGRIRATGSKNVVLPKNARLIATAAGATNVKASSITVLVSGVLTGA